MWELTEIDVCLLSFPTFPHLLGFIQTLNSAYPHWIYNIQWVPGPFVEGTQTTVGFSVVRAHTESALLIKGTREGG